VLVIYPEVHEEDAPLGVLGVPLTTAQ